MTTIDLISLSVCVSESRLSFPKETKAEIVISSLRRKSQLASILLNMPELPDLQVFSRNLDKRLTGKKVEKIHAIRARKLNTSEKELQRAIAGATLTSVVREGKELHFHFDNGNVLGLHLMLKGELHFFVGKNEERFSVLEILFSDATGLVMTDFQAQATPTLNPPAREAPDALSEESGYKFLKEKLGHSGTTIKKLLTDQKVIRGIGNAYADEILWHARISPFSTCSKIPDAAIRHLAKSIRMVFANAEKSILEADPDIIGGERREFMAIHNPERTHSPTSSEICVRESGGRKTYYTNEQVLYE